MNAIIISATKYNEEGFTRMPLGRSLAKMNIAHHIDYKNTRGLSEVYNAAIDKYKDLYDTLIFVHDDVFINDIFMLEKLEYAFAEADCVGVAGTQHVNLRSDKVAWHICDRTKWLGAVMHPAKCEGPKSSNSMYINSFGPFGKEALSVDGLFIACKSSMFKDPNIRFDTRFEFDFYDMDFCLTLFKNNLKLTVEPILVTHESHGDGLTSSRYDATQEVFKDKWLNTEV